VRYLRGFGAFWYDFLVGDRPELFVGSIVVLVLVWLAIRAGLDPAVSGLVLTLVILGLGALSLWAATRSKPR
jgi:ABC-type uncharacterized transport system permease subunit